MITAVKSGASRMVLAGKDLIRGLINGIKNMGAAAIGAITGVVDGVINKAKSLLKIKSPSRVFRQFGEYTSEGLAIGVSSEAGAAIRAVSDMASGMTKAFVPDLAMPESDYANQIRAINRQTERQMTARLDSELSVSRQPANIVLRLGNNDYKVFAGDIYSTAERQLKREGKFRV